MRVLFILQYVVLPAAMEEHAILHLPLLTVSVPVDTGGPTASTEVHRHT